MNKLLHYGLVLIFILCGIATYAQHPTLEWAQRFNSIDSISSEDKATAIVTDAQGNVYIIGTSQGMEPVRLITLKYSPVGQLLWRATYQTDEMVLAHDIAVDNMGGVYVLGGSVTIRYDALTGQQRWLMPYRGSANGNGYPSAITTDNSGSVYVTGTSENYDTGGDITTVRYDALTGDEKWVALYSGPGNNDDAGTDIAVDNNGHVYVTGSTTNPDFISRNMVTIQYEAETGKELWVIPYSNPGNEFGDNAQGRSIIVDNSGNVYVIGFSYGPETSADYVTISYDVTGKQRWLSRYNNEPGNFSYDEVAAIAVDNQGGVYVTGTSGLSITTVRYNAQTGKQDWATPYERPNSFISSAKGITADNTGGVYVVGTSSDDFVTLRYNALSGQQEWDQIFDSSQQPNSDDAVGLALDNQGKLYVTGTSTAYQGDEKANIAIIAYEADTGSPLWTQLHDRLSSFPTSDRPLAVAIDKGGNIYVTGTSESENIAKITTVKYSPAGDSLWAVQYGEAGFTTAAAIAVDNRGSVFVTGTSNNYSGDSDADFITIRYDAATGQEIWASRYDAEEEGYSEERAAGMAIDTAGNIYVVGTSRNYLGNTMADIVAIRYDAANGDSLWVSRYDASMEGFNDDIAVGITTDPEGAVYVTGNTTNYDNESSSDFITIRFESTDGSKKWEKRFDSGEGYRYDKVAAIEADEQGGIYITGSSDSGYTTLRYDATTGEQVWRSKRIDTNTDFYAPTAIAVDKRGGVYVTGAAYNSSTFIDFGTVRYDAATGDQDWAQNYNYIGSNGDWATAIVADSVGDIYITGYSQVDQMGSVYSTVKYNGSSGDQVWSVQTEGPFDSPTNLVIDSQGNVIVTGYSAATSIDFLTIKYSQPSVCSELPEVSITGPSVVRAGTSGSAYSLAVPEASSFFWEITTPNGSSFTSFTGQGTSSISVDWPGQPEFYKVSVTYSAGEGCPTTTSVNYIHVFDPKAGFVTGAGWSTSPVSPSLELMQQEGRAYWAFGARYKEKADEIAQGSLLLVLENGYVFRATSVTDGSLVIADDRAYFTGTGSLARGGFGSITIDPRRLAYLVSAVDGDLKNGNGKRNREKDRLRLMIWTLQEDGSRGDVLYDNQLSCSSSELQLNAVACQEIERGSIVIHRKDIKSVSDLFATAEAEPADQGMQAYPTAFQERTTIAFTLEQPSGYSLDLYDLKGALVRQIATGDAENGKRYEHEVRAAGLSEGLYFARLTTDQGVQTVKIVVQR